MSYARLHNHNYSGTGFYFITFATKPRRPLFSEIIGGRIRLKPEGHAVLDAWREIARDAPEYSLRLSAIMPDHFHGTLVCIGGSRLHLGTLIGRMKGRSLQAIRKLRNDPHLKVWEKGYHDYIAVSQEVFDRFSDYVSENPLRWQLRHDNPQWFRKQSAIAHPRLPNETRWTAFGDQTLLDYPWLLPVVISRHLEGAALKKKVDETVAFIEQGAVALGGFISPGERLVAAALATLPRARMIYMHPWGLAQYKPRGRIATERLASDKTLVLSGFPDEVEQMARRENCLRNNAWAQAIAASPAQAASQLRRGG